jgi:hypothetical protein
MPPIIVKVVVGGDVGDGLRFRLTTTALDDVPD